jgi:phosphoribosylamine--glycine ligase
MNVLIIGQGGREHAIARALKNSLSVDDVHALPGSDGMATDSVAKIICHNLDWQNFSTVLEVIRKNQIELVVIGPEIPLAEGLSDYLRENEIKVFGPDQAGAQLEASKVFSKEFMLEAGVPTAAAWVVSEVSEVMRVAREELSPPYVLKADGLAAGKGVFICKDESELEQAAHSLFTEKILGAAGEQALLEEFTTGFEISYLVLTDGDTYQPLLLAQDHKRLQDGERGPNTGGMGTIAPVKIDEALEFKIRKQVVEPALKEIKRKGFIYRGVLFIGLMIQKKAKGELVPSVLEFNVRFGDPETQVIMPLLDGDWGELLRLTAEGRLVNAGALKWRKQNAVCVVLAAEDYPQGAKKDVVIEGDLKAETAKRYFLHAGTKIKRSKVSLEPEFVTNGGRVLNAVGLGATAAEAIKNAYQQADLALWPGRQFRSDIGQKEKA